MKCVELLNIESMTALKKGSKTVTHLIKFGPIHTMFVNGNQQYTHRPPGFDYTL